MGSQTKSCEYNSVNSQYDISAQSKTRSDLRTTNTITKQEPQKDHFIRAEFNKNDPAHNGKFNSKQALKNLIKGLVSPLTMLIRHPFKSAGILLAGIGLATICPITIPLFVISGIIFGGLQIIKGISKVITLASQKNFDEAERAFQDIGAGTASILLSRAGLKSSAGIILETKATTSALSNGKALATALEEGMKASTKAANMTNLETLQENISLFTTKEGLQTFFKVTTPNYLKNNFKLTIERFKSCKEKYTESKERRALTNEEITEQANKTFQECAKELQLSQEELPQLNIDGYAGHPLAGGGYQVRDHEIIIPPAHIRYKTYTLDEVIPHELRHAQRSITIRKALSDEEIRAAIVDTIQSEPNERTLQFQYLGTQEERADFIFHGITIPSYKADGWIKTNPTPAEKELAIQYLKESIETLEANARKNPFSNFVESSRDINQRLEELKTTDPRLVERFERGDKKAIVIFILRNLSMILRSFKKAFNTSDETTKELDYLISPEEIVAREDAINRQSKILNGKLQELGSNLSNPYKVLTYRALLKQQIKLESEHNVNILAREIRQLRTQLGSESNSPNTQLQTDLKQAEEQLRQYQLIAAILRLDIANPVPKPYNSNPALYSLTRDK